MGSFDCRGFQDSPVIGQTQHDLISEMVCSEKQLNRRDFLAMLVPGIVRCVA
jgi:hypothetical protein